MTYKKFFIIGVVVVVMLCTACAADSKDTMMLDDVTPMPTIDVTPTPTASPVPTATPLPVRSNDFRFGVWGDSIDVVEQYEKEDGNIVSERDEDTLLYKGIELLDHKYHTLYFFSDEGLYKGVYMLSDDLRAYIYPSIYDALKETLTGLYGEPTKDKRHEIEPRLIKYADNDGQAVELGYLAFEAIWETDSSSIELVLISAKIGTISLYVSYTSRDIVPAVDTSGL